MLRFGLTWLSKPSSAESENMPKTLAILVSRAKADTIASPSRNLAKGTPERRKHCKAVARVHERIKFSRDNFTHQESRQIVDRFGVIAVEDLHVNRMVHNHCLAKSIHDAAWSVFFSQLSNKAEEAGRQFIKVNPA